MAKTSDTSKIRYLLRALVPSASGGSAVFTVHQTYRYPEVCYLSSACHRPGTKRLLYCAELADSLIAATQCATVRHPEQLLKRTGLAELPLHAATALLLCRTELVHRYTPGSSARRHTLQQLLLLRCIDPGWSGQS
ncbi:hypothetical protein NDU88_005824 [Pleurodeles waltl]|uniref:Uncharacterized protein n=1 Tax=Pleurodeles waltl TaxID=8319 RepID=A0AAV7N5F9_PLEWA|nr:hypothetical protein NDU88_005824 [Pleurodeles waltl]